MSFKANFKSIWTYGISTVLIDFWKWFATWCVLLKSGELFNLAIITPLTSQPALCIALLTCLMISICRCYPRKIVGRILSPGCEIEISQGDVLNQPGHLIIGTNDVFDTELGQIVSPRSVQGQFLISKYNSDTAMLNSDIEASIAKQELGLGLLDETKTIGKNRRYPIGTVLKIASQQRISFWLVCATMQQENSGLVSKADSTMILNALHDLWDIVRISTNADEIAMPLIGTEFARSNIDRTTMCLLIVASFLDASKKSLVSKKLHLVIYPQDLAHINWFKIKEFVHSISD
jgi:hypothetical protein